MSKEKNGPFLVLGIMGFVGFLLEFVIAIVEMTAFGMSMGDMANTSPFEIYRHWILTYVIWVVCAYILHRIAKAKYGFNMFSFKGEVSAKSALIILVMCALHIVYATYSWGWQLKPYAEYLNMESTFPGFGLPSIALQLAYYFFEAMLMMMIVAFGQEFGERKFAKKNIPWGGILLALTWGLFHMVTKFSLETAISCSVIAVYFGVCYLLLKKNAICSWLLFFVVYTL